MAATKRHWSTLPPVHFQFERVPDDEHGRRMVRCKRCRRVVPSLGIGYHLGGGQPGVRPCTERV